MAKFMVVHGSIQGHPVGSILELPESMARFDTLRMVEADGGLAPGPAVPSEPETPSVPQEAAGEPVPSRQPERKVVSEPETPVTSGRDLTSEEWAKLLSEETTP